MKTSTSEKPDAGFARVHYLGRFDLRDPAKPRFAWPGSAIAATFEGSGIDAVLLDAGTNFFSVVIDGGEAATLPTKSGEGRYTLASGLSPGRHTLVLTKRTESFLGTVSLLGLSPHAGRLVPSPPPFKRRIELVGDSITCGYGILGKRPECPFRPDTEDETLAYGALAGKALGAQVSAIAWSGRGMYREYDGKTDEQMPVLFERTLPSEPLAWGFTTPEPDVVVINLGTNDFARGDPGEPFERAYAAFLRQLRGHYPHAQVICTLSPMLVDSHEHSMARSTAKAAIQNAMSERAAEGDTHVSYLAFDPPLPSEGYGCDYHPSAATHRTMAAALERAIRTLTGW